MGSLAEVNSFCKKNAQMAESQTLQMGGDVN
jgi:hypothetical protein